MTYQRNPLADEIIEVREAHRRTLEEAQHLRNLLEDARNELRELRADKIRLQARIANLKKYRPQAPADLVTPRDEADIRRMEADHEIAQFHRQRRANHQGFGRKKAS